MDLILDFGRLWRWAFGAKDYSPEVKNALQRWLEAIKPHHRKRAMLSETNAARKADRHKRVQAVRDAVAAIVGDRTDYGVKAAAFRAVAKTRGESFDTVRKLYWSKSVPWKNLGSDQDAGRE